MLTTLVSFQISRALAGTDKKDLMRKLPKFIYDEEKALEVSPLLSRCTVDKYLWRDHWMLDYISSCYLDELLILFIIPLYLVYFFLFFFPKDEFCEMCMLPWSFFGTAICLQIVHQLVATWCHTVIHQSCKIFRLSCLLISGSGMTMCNITTEIKGSSKWEDNPEPVISTFHLMHSWYSLVMALDLASYRNSTERRSRTKAQGGMLSLDNLNSFPSLLILDM